MPVAGKSSKLQVSTDDTVYNDVADINSVTFTQNGETVDVTAFDSLGWREFIQGLKGATMTAEGFWNGSDTNGQVAIRNAWANDSALYAKYLYDGTAGFKGQVKVTSVEVSGAVDGAVTATFDLQITGAVSTV